MCYDLPLQFKIIRGTEIQISPNSKHLTYQTQGNFQMVIKYPMHEMCIINLTLKTATKLQSLINEKRQKFVVHKISILTSILPNINHNVLAIAPHTTGCQSVIGTDIYTNYSAAIPGISPKNMIVICTTMSISF